MTYLIFRYMHLLGLTLMGAGLIGVWYADLRSRQVRGLDLPLFGELVLQIAVFYDGLVVPGALLLLGSGTWLTMTVYGGWAFQPPSRIEKRVGKAGGGRHLGRTPDRRERNDEGQPKKGEKSDDETQDRNT
jgi:hypothetical protein